MFAAAARQIRLVGSFEVSHHPSAAFKEKDMQRAGAAGATGRFILAGP